LTIVLAGCSTISFTTDKDLIPETSFALDLATCLNNDVYGSMGSTTNVGKTTKRTSDVGWVKIDGHTGKTESAGHGKTIDIANPE